eukprot:COSAG05_NODE_1312_length_5217_cov_2.233685_4_plen_360_part_00
MLRFPWLAPGLPVYYWLRAAHMLRVLLTVAMGLTLGPHQPVEAGPGECGDHARTPADLFGEMDSGYCRTLEFERPLTNIQVSQLAERLRQLKDGLLKLELSGTDIGDDGIAVLAPALAHLVRKGIVKMELARNRITDAGVASLVDQLLPALQDTPPGTVLHPSHTRRAHSGISLDLGMNQISASGSLATLLPYLSELDASDNFIDDSGVLPLLEALAAPTPLHELELDRNQISADTIDRLRTAAPRIKLDAKYQRGRTSSTATTSTSGGDGIPPLPPIPPVPPSPPDPAAVDWEGAYEAVDELEAADHLTKGAAAALRGMAARDDPALIRVYERFRGMQRQRPEILAQRLMDLLAGKDL